MGPASRADGSHRIVMVVGETSAVRDAVVAAVRELGHTALEVRDAGQAWSAAGSHSADVVIAGWPEPGTPAHALLAGLRDAERDRRLPYTPFIALAAGGGMGASDDVVGAAVDAVLQVPVCAPDLARALRAADRIMLLERRAAVQQEELRARDERLREEVRRDGATRLGNRLRLDEDLRRLRGRVRRYGHRATAVLLSIDGLRRYGAEHGPIARDELLGRLGRIVREALRDADSAYRFAADQVLVLLPEQGEDGGVAVAERCRSGVAALRIPHPRSSVADTVTLSAGVAELPTDVPDDLETWLQGAVEALDAARASGCNRVARASATRVSRADGNLRP